MRFATSFLFKLFRSNNFGRHELWQSSSLFLSHVIPSNKANEVLFLELPLYQYQFSFPVSLEAAQITQLNLRQCSGIIQSLIATSSNSDDMMNCRMF